jgi:SAM-dependent methyltransferase
MGESLSAWLSLRQAADTRARSTALTQAVAAALPAGTPLQILDLGSGTGANIRYLAPRLRGPQQWLAVDRDAALLDEVPRTLAEAPFDCRIDTQRQELGAFDRALFAGRHLVTASALLDLVSAEWIDALAERCREARAAVLFALSYDGRSTCTPREPEDDAVLEWFNQHQRVSDKGFGRAAGPDASRAAVRSLRAAGYDVQRARSDWMLPPGEAALQRVLIDGWASAVIEIVPDQSALVASWRARRLAHVDSGCSHIVVGHEDVAAWI